MKSLVVSEQATKLMWRPVPPRMIRADSPDAHNYQDSYIEAVIDAIHEPVLILDKDLLIQSVNVMMLKKFKLTKKSMLGRAIFPDSRDYPSVKQLIKKLQNLSNKNMSFKNFELTYPFETVGEKTMLISAKRIHFDTQRSDVILLRIEDITQKKLVERQKDDFVGYVTHELKTPMTSLSAFIQLLQSYHSQTGDKKSQFLLAKAAGQLERLTKLLNSFTQVYQTQTGKLQLHKEKLDLYELVRETVEMFQYTTTTHNISIEGNITKPILADKERVRQVLINLLINAIKYSPNADAIVVRLREEENYLVVNIQDFGPGIPQEAQERIFERFFRVRGPQEHNIKGLGLGLYIAFEIVKTHQGELWVESVEGKGSTFSFSLPIK